MSSIIKSSAFKNIFNLAKSSTFLTMLSMVIAYFLGPYYGLIAPASNDYTYLYAAAALFAIPMIVKGGQTLINPIIPKSLATFYYKDENFDARNYKVSNTLNKLLASGVATGGALYLMSEKFGDTSSAFTPMIIISGITALYQAQDSADSEAEDGWLSTALNAVVYIASLAGITLYTDSILRIKALMGLYVFDVVKTVETSRFVGSRDVIDVTAGMSNRIFNDYASGPSPSLNYGKLADDYETLRGQLKTNIRSEPIFRTFTEQVRVTPGPSEETFTVFSAENYNKVYISTKQKLEDAYAYASDSKARKEDIQTYWESIVKYMTESLNSAFETVKTAPGKAWESASTSYLSKERKEWVEGSFNSFTTTISSAIAWISDVFSKMYARLEGIVGVENAVTLSKITGYVVAGMLVSWLCKKMYDRLFKNTKPKVDKFDVKCINEFGSITYRGFNTVSQLFRSMAYDEQEHWDSNLPILYKFFNDVGFEKQDGSCPSNYLGNVRDIFEKFMGIVSKTQNTDRGFVVVSFLELLLNFKDLITDHSKFLKRSVTEKYIIKINSVEKYTTFEITELAALLTRKIANGEKITKPIPAIDRQMFKLIEASEAVDKKIGARIVQKELSMVDI
jgi:hypothetical protein